MKALFVVDMQEEYVGVNNKYGYDSVNLIQNINKRIEKAKENDKVIIYIKNIKRLRSGEKCSDFAIDLNVVSDNIFYKDKSSLFSNEKVCSFLHNNNISEITFIGVDGNCCVASGALDAVKLGFKVTLELKCVGIKNNERFEKKKNVFTKAGIILSE